MPRPRPPHLHREQTRHGSVVWYVRIGKGPRIRIKATFGTSEFDAAYRAAVQGDTSPSSTRDRPKTDSLAWLVARYRETRAWSILAPASRRQRENIFRPILDQSGTAPFAAITRKTIQAGLDRRAATPFQARNFLDAMRGLFRWATEAEHVKADPTQGIRVAKPKTEGFAVWTEEEIGKFEARWPVGTRERLAFDLLLYTGLRRGDVSRLGRQHVRDGIITMRTEKTGQIVTLPILPQLAATIAASPTGELTFLVGLGGRPMVKEAFGNWFREICDAAGVPGSAHGLRKAGATRAADNGATEAELEAIFGWRGGRMASLYTRASNRKRLALAAMSKLSAPEQSQDTYSRTHQKGAGAAAKNSTKTDI